MNNARLIRRSQAAIRPDPFPPDPNQPIHIHAMEGMGDSIYQRPFIRSALKAFPGVYLKTPWPQLYSDMPGLKLVRSDTAYRTQTKNVARWRGTWLQPIEGRPWYRQHYGSVGLSQFGIIGLIASKAPWHDGEFSWTLPEFPEHRITRTPYAVVRPVTVRREWSSHSRGCDPRYIQEAIDILKARGLTVISVADVDGVHETFVGDAPRGADVEYHAGELDCADLVELVRGAELCVGGVGWIAPMCFNTRTPLFLVYGGRGAHNAPEVITHPSMDLTRVEHVLPDRFCRCDASYHDCPRTISNFAGRLNAFLDRLTPLAGMRRPLQGSVSDGLTFPQIVI